MESSSSSSTAAADGRLLASLWRSVSSSAARLTSPVAVETIATPSSRPTGNANINSNSRSGSASEVAVAAELVSAAARVAARAVEAAKLQQQQQQPQQQQQQQQTVVSPKRQQKVKRRQKQKQSEDKELQRQIALEERGGDKDEDKSDAAEAIDLPTPSVVLCPGLDECLVDPATQAEAIRTKLMHRARQATEAQQQQQQQQQQEEEEEEKEEEAARQQSTDHRKSWSSWLGDLFLEAQPPPPKPSNVVDAPATPTPVDNDPNEDEDETYDRAKYELLTRHHRALQPVANRVRKVVVIGIHGWSLLGGVLSDDPVHISDKFARMTSEAIARCYGDKAMIRPWPRDEEEEQDSETKEEKEAKVAADAASSSDESAPVVVEVCQIALSGHGKVEQRVQLYLEQQLAPYRPYIAEADAVFFCLHSQGCIVGALLLHQLLLGDVADQESIDNDEGDANDDEHVDAADKSKPSDSENAQERVVLNLHDKARVAVLCMAGIHHGPFPDTPTDFFFSATRQLFELNHAHSSVTQAYFDAWRAILAMPNVRLLCVASWYDQVVPLHSSTLHALNAPRHVAVTPDDVRALLGKRDVSEAVCERLVHDRDMSWMWQNANVMRAVCIDSAHYQADFFTALIGLCVHARNVGVFTDLLPHLSGFIRGRLFRTGAGAHTTIHSEPGVYDMFVRWSLCGRGHVLESAAAQHSAASFVVAPPRLALDSAVVWGASFQQAFFTSQMNSFMLQARCRELLSLCLEMREQHPALYESAVEMCDLFSQWQPRLSKMKFLRQSLAPAIGHFFRQTTSKEPRVIPLASKL